MTLYASGAWSVQHLKTEQTLEMLACCVLCLTDVAAQQFTYRGNANVPSCAFSHKEEVSDLSLMPLAAASPCFIRR